MKQSTANGMARQVRCHAQAAMKDQDLCFGRLLDGQQAEAAIARNGVRFRDCLYTPLLTLWTFLYQVLSADQSCRAAVARLLAFIGCGGDAQVSAKTDPYCKARQRLPEQLPAELARENGAELHRQVPGCGLLCNRPIKLGDGTTCSAADTPQNQAAYPQPGSSKVGVGFPLLRMVALISLSAGSVLDAAIGPYGGKRTGETALLRQLLGRLEAGDVFVADAIFSNYWTIALLLERGVDVVSGHDGKRKVDFRTGQRLGRKDHLITWQKPARPGWMDQSVYQRLPQTLCIRQLEVQVQPRGFRVKRVVLVTTLRDEQLYPAGELAAAYRLRWYAELDLRAIKCVMRMDVLRCKSPSMVRKEIWMHLLAYNLVRKLMAQAALAAGCAPRQISFTGTLQTLLAFAAVGWAGAIPDAEGFYRQILRAVATHRVGDRPDRVEPRMVKRRPKKHTLLNEPRAIARARLLK